MDFRSDTGVGKHSVRWRTYKACRSEQGDYGTNLDGVGSALDRVLSI